MCIRDRLCACMCIVCAFVLCAGASYTVDRVRGNCTVGTIDPVGFDAISTSTGLRMRNSHEFFFDDSNDYSYEGIVSFFKLPLGNTLLSHLLFSVVIVS